MASGALTGGNVKFPESPSGNILDDSGNWVAPGGAAAVPPGVTVPYGGNAAPAGWLLCDGAAVARSTYAALFAVIGTKFGSGDGSTTFNLPLMASRVPIGVDVADSNINDVGKVFGSKTHTLTIQEIPSHSHVQSLPTSQTGAQNSGTRDTSTTGSGADALSTAAAGGGGAHNNMQPSIAFYWIVKT